MPTSKASPPRAACPLASCSTISEADAALTVADLQALGRSIRQYAIDGYGPLGPLAIVVGQGQAHFHAAFFADASPTNRPLRIFRDARQAREWLVGLRRS